MNWNRFGSHCSICFNHRHQGSKLVWQQIIVRPKGTESFIKLIGPFLPVVAHPFEVLEPLEAPWNIA